MSTFKPLKPNREGYKPLVADKSGYKPLLTEGMKRQLREKYLRGEGEDPDKLLEPIEDKYKECTAKKKGFETVEKSGYPVCSSCGSCTKYLQNRFA